MNSLSLEMLVLKSTQLINWSEWSIRYQIGSMVSNIASESELCRDRMGQDIGQPEWHNGAQSSCQ